MSTENKADSTGAGALVHARGSVKRERRQYQNVALVAVRKVRQIALYWARRCRKSTTLGDIAFDEMSKEPGRMVIAASASLLLGRELVGVTLTAAEQAMVVANEASAMRSALEIGAAERGLEFKVADSAKGKIMNGISPEDFSQMYQGGRMEMRLYFSPARFSRLQVIAPNPATARSWRATVLRDECGFTNPNFEEELRIATDPMMRDTPDLKIIYASNLSSNDRHRYFEDTMPAELTAASEEDQFPANANGHLYYGQNGMLIHRVALKDAYAAGHALYDDEGHPMSYDECRVFPQFRLGWDETYALNHKPGGGAAIDLVALISAQRRGIGQCHFVVVESPADLQRALSLLRQSLRNGPVGIGFDVASTVEETSNPSVICVTENLAGERFQRLMLVFKSKQRAVMSEYLRGVIMVVRERPSGGPARRLCIDASNERLAAEETKQDLAHLIPIELVVGGVSVEPLPMGYKDAINYKTYQGDLYCAAVNDGRTVMAPDDYVKADHRLVVKDQGRYSCAVDTYGRHGDTFDAAKQAEYALRSGSGCFSSETMPMIVRDNAIVRAGFRRPVHVSSRKEWA